LFALASTQTACRFCDIRALAACSSFGTAAAWDPGAAHLGQVGPLVRLERAGHRLGLGQLVAGGARADQVGDTSVSAAICSPRAQAPPRGMWVWASQLSIIPAAESLPASVKRWTARA
jgi:hypothetical protein